MWAARLEFARYDRPARLERCCHSLESSAYRQVICSEYRSTLSAERAQAIDEVEYGLCWALEDYKQSLVQLPTQMTSAATTWVGSASWIDSTVQSCPRLALRPPPAGRRPWSSLWSCRIRRPLRNLPELEYVADALSRSHYRRSPTGLLRSAERSKRDLSCMSGIVLRRPSPQNRPHTKLVNAEVLVGRWGVCMSSGRRMRLDAPHEICDIMQ